MSASSSYYQYAYLSTWHQYVPRARANAANLPKIQC